MSLLSGKVPHVQKVKQDGVAQWDKNFEKNRACTMRKTLGIRNTAAGC